MQFPESWLRQYCNPPLTTLQLAETLTMAGLEVEEMRTVAPPFTGVVVGQIVDIHSHPNADRLKVCSVDIGLASTLTIVCGAPNAEIGMRVACAQVGATLPSPGNEEPFRIKLGRLRGVESQGMLCSSKELGLSEDTAGLMVLSSDAPLGIDLRVHLDLDDTLFTLKLTPNLAHCLSIYGVARELSALTATPLTPLVTQAVSPTLDARLRVNVTAPDLCGRFSGRVIRNIDFNAKTPSWMVDRLLRCGQRSVNALVDISNYVMFECGQPTHVFDLDKIDGDLTVRWANVGEKLVLLNGATVELDTAVGVISDNTCVESLAGIMGGNATAVSAETRDVYVEAAFWWPKAVAGRSRRYNFSTEAGHRFERGVDPSLTVLSIERITRLILDVCGGDAGPVDDQLVSLREPSSVSLRVSRAEQVIGMPLSIDVCSKALRGLGLHVTEGVGVLAVLPPPHRFDIQIEEDLIEEVARVVGYEQLPKTLPFAPVVAKLNPENRRNAFVLRRLMATMGFQETINFSFVDENWEHDVSGNPSPIRLLNPIAKHMGVMRSSLLASLLSVAKFNLDRKAERVAIFEIGRVFLKDPTVPDSDATVAGYLQPQRLAGLLYGATQPLHWDGGRRNVDFFDAKGHVEAVFAPRTVKFEACEHPSFHPGRCAQVRLNDNIVGHLGELHPKLKQSLGFSSAPILFELDFDAVSERTVPNFQAFSKLQPLERDLAVWVPESVCHDQIMQVIQAAVPAQSLKGARLFDIYRQPVGHGTGRPEKSMAIRLSLHLGDDGGEQEVDSLVSTVVFHLESKLDARLRA